jgi:hypothetical protein
MQQFIDLELAAKYSCPDCISKTHARVVVVHDPGCPRQKGIT